MRSLTYAEELPLAVFLIIATFLFIILEWNTFGAIFDQNSGLTLSCSMAMAALIGFGGTILPTGMLGEIKERTRLASLAPSKRTSVALPVMLAALKQFFGSVINAVFFLAIFLVVPVVAIFYLANLLLGELASLFLSAMISTLTGWAVGVAYYFIRYDLMDAD